MRGHAALESLAISKRPLREFQKISVRLLASRLVTWNHRNQRNHRKCQTNSRRIPRGHELLIKKNILGTKIRKMGTKSDQKPSKTKIHERGPGKSSRYKTQMDRNLFSPGSCSDHQFEPIYILNLHKYCKYTKYTKK